MKKNVVREVLVIAGIFIFSCLMDLLSVGLSDSYRMIHVIKGATGFLVITYSIYWFIRLIVLGIKKLRKKRKGRDV